MVDVENLLNKRILVIDFRGEQTTGKLTAVSKNNQGQIVSLTIEQRQGSVAVIPWPCKVRWEYV